VIHRLIEELIYNDEIVSYGLLFESPEVILEDRRQLVKKSNNEGGIGIPASDCAEVKIVVLDINVRFSPTA
jgi:hypothetical protein